MSSLVFSNPLVFLGMYPIKRHHSTFFLIGVISYEVHSFLVIEVPGSAIKAIMNIMILDSKEILLGADVCNIIVS